jgi:hypothetical protein
MPGARCTRSLVCRMKEAYEHSHHRYAADITAFPARWLDRLLRALPGVSGLLATVAAQIVLRNLTPASRGQDHTA